MLVSAAAAYHASRVWAAWILSRRRIDIARGAVRPVMCMTYMQSDETPLPMRSDDKIAPLAGQGAAPGPPLLQQTLLVKKEAGTRKIVQSEVALGALMREPDSGRETSLSVCRWSPRWLWSIWGRENA